MTTAVTDTALSIFDADFAEHAETIAAARDSLRAPFARLVETARACLARGGKILFFGNGGSAADAQHLAAELVVRYRRNRAAIAAIALTTDTSLITAAANDFSYEDIFSRQIEALCRPEDLAVGISTSGRSENVNRALVAARRIGATAAAFSGRDGGALVGLADPLLIVPSTTIARIQEVHILLGHMFCDALEREVP